MRLTRRASNESTQIVSTFAWLTGHFSSRGKALSLYKRGMAKAKNRDHHGAIDDYTAAIGRPDISSNVKPMVLFNRALVYVAIGDDPKAIDDLNAVLATAEAAVNVKTMARQKLARMAARSDKSNA